MTRHLEKHDDGSYHYPAVIQGADGTIHFIYSYFVKAGKSMKHVATSQKHGSARAIRPRAPPADGSHARHGHRCKKARSDAR